MSDREFFAPIYGRALPLSRVNDPAFSSGSLGDGYAIQPLSNGTVAFVAPVAGTISMVADTGHAVGIETDDGLKILLHLGVDTVDLKGAPFTVHVRKGDRVSAGDSLGTMNIAEVTRAEKDPTAIIVVTNSRKKGIAVHVDEGEVQSGRVAAVGIAAPTSSTSTQSSSAHQAQSALHGDNLTGFDATARDIIAHVGGPENVVSVIHCITRVRFYLKDDSLADDAAISDLDGVISVARAAGQFQVVIGADVKDVYNAVIAQLPGVDPNEGDAAVVQAERPTTIGGWINYAFSGLIGVITGSMIPIIGVLAASGILKGFLALGTQFGLISNETSTYTFIDAMSTSMFFFLPIIIGFTAAKRLGADPIIVAIIGGVLVFPSVVTMSNPDAEGYRVIAQIGQTVFNADFFGIPVSLPQGNAYGYSIFPAIVAAWLASKIEPVLNRVIPAVVRSIFAPLLEIFIVSTLVLVVFGPIVMTISGGIAAGVNWVLGLSYPVAGFIIGGLYQCLVIFGLHWAVIPIISQQIADPGYSPLNAIVSVSMIAQGGGALALWIKAKSPKIKRLAGPATISAMCGVTEPAMYGLNLKYGRVFITSSIGGAVGGLITGLLGVNMWGFTGAFVGFPSFVNPDGIDGSFTGFWIASIVTLVTSFACTYFFGFKESDFETEKTVEKVRIGNREPVEK